MRSFIGCVMGLLLCSSALGSTIYKYVDENGVVTYTDRRVQGAEIIIFNDTIEEPTENSVYVETRKHPGGETLIVHNELFTPVEVELSITRAEHISNVPSEPVRWVIPPRDQIRLLTLYPNGSGTPDYEYRLRYAMGDPRAQHTLSHYPLPWKGGPFRMTQGPGGRYSHTGPRGRYAIDIAMPEGTPILAARDGRVVSIRNHQRGRGDNPAGNFVRLLHDDGTMSVYLHLQHRSVKVTEGQRVRAGTVIARSGNTGNSTGPHLHFVVQKNVGLETVSIPFEFAQPVNSLPNFAFGGE
ncbi:MAG: M23 family metallopeptidase [Gammaproteobacteria bacterium]|nr:M23 family metallopeptidase [Gammaproteobacteria bacterium]